MGNFNLPNWKAARQKARTDIFFLCKILHYDDVTPRVHGQMVAMLQKFVGGIDNGSFDCTASGFKIRSLDYKPAVPMWQLTGSPRKALIMAPRGSLKTTVCDIAYIIQWILNYPDVRILLSTATGDQVKKIIGAVEDQFRMNEDLRFFFPDFCPRVKNVKEWGTQDGFIIPARKVVLKEPTLSACTVGSVVAGGHYDVIINDDLVDKENVRTPDQIQTVISHFGFMGPLLETNPLPPPKEHDRGWTYVIGTPYSYSDLYGIIRDSEAALPEEQRTWTILAQSAKNLDGTLMWPERITQKMLDEDTLDPTKGSAYVACTPAGSPVLMADWSDKPIEQIRPGDEVIGFVRGRQNQLQIRSRVKAVHKTLGLVQKLTFSSGRVAYCTPDHKWFTGRYSSPKEPHRKTYRPAKIGSELVSVAAPLKAPNQDEQRWLDWLGGILDGEGSCHGLNLVTVSQSQGANPEVCSMIAKCLSALGITWYQYDKPPYKGVAGSSLWALHGGRSTKRRLLHQCKMAKKQRFLDACTRSKRLTEFDRCRHKVVSIEPLSYQEVYALETETGNYVVWGFASSNSQYYCNPIPDKGGLVDDIRQILFMPRSVINELLPRLRLHCTIDLHGMEEGKRGHDNDYTVMTTAGFGPDGRPYIVEIRRGRFTPDEVINQIFELHVRYPQMVDFKMEKDAHARVLLPFLRREMEKRGKYPMVTPIQRDNRTSKANRIKGLQPWFRNGDIRFPNDLTLPLKEALINEIMRFPKYNHDDILDTLADQLYNRDGEMNYDVVPTLRPPIQQQIVQRFLGFDSDGNPRFTGEPEHDTTNRDVMTGY